MPAMLDDPTAPVIYRTSGAPPYPTPYAPLPPEIVPRQVTLRDRITTATLIPFSSPDQVPKSLLTYLCALLNREIEKGDTYPMINELPIDSFGPYWFANFGAIMFLGEIGSVEEVWQMEREGKDWSQECLGSFYVKPNYPGRSSHVCNGGFLVTDASRNKGVGRLMGEGYLEWAPKLGYVYSVFNLVYETNIASVRIWDSLGFKRIGRVKGCGNLKSFPDQFVDAIIYGRDLTGESEEYLTEERFDKIRFYLKTGTYPAGSDRAEKSRLRSAATHYKLIPETETEPEKLMLKGKEVISDPNAQYEIARNTHMVSHGGINKTTATIADRYHWVRIKETVSLAVKNCEACKEMSQPKTKPDPKSIRSKDNVRNGRDQDASPPSPAGKDDNATPLSNSRLFSPTQASPGADGPHLSPSAHPSSTSPQPAHHHSQPTHHSSHHPQHAQALTANMSYMHASPSTQHPHALPLADPTASAYADYDMHDVHDMPVDPQLMGSGSLAVGVGVHHHHNHQQAHPQMMDELQHFGYATSGAGQYGGGYAAQGGLEGYEDMGMGQGPLGQGQEGFGGVGAGEDREGELQRQLAGVGEVGLGRFGRGRS